MDKINFSMVLLMSLVFGSSFAIFGNSAFAQNYGYNDYSDQRYPPPNQGYPPYPPPNQGYPPNHGYPDPGYGKNDNFKHFKLDFYVVTGEPDESGEGVTELTSTAVCDKKDEVTGGGFELETAPTTTTPTAEAKITSSIPDENIGQSLVGLQEGWTATASTPEGTPETTLTAYAVCFDNKPKHTNNSID